MTATLTTAQIAFLRGTAINPRHGFAGGGSSKTANALIARGLIVAIKEGGWMVGYQLTDAGRSVL